MKEVRDQAHTQTHSRMHTGWRVTTHRPTRDALSEHLEGREGWKHAKHALIEREGENGVNEEEMKGECSSQQPLAGLESVCL